MPPTNKYKWVLSEQASNNDTNPKKPKKQKQFKLHKQKLSSNCTPTEARRPDDQVKTKQQKKLLKKISKRTK